MKMTITCKSCDWEFVAHDEYEGELAFDVHCMEEHVPASPPFNDDECKPADADGKI